MVTLGASVVLLFLGLSAGPWAVQGQRGSAPVEAGNTMAELWKELQKLSSMVTEQRERLRHMEEEANAQRAQLSKAEMSLAASVSQMQDTMAFSSLYKKDQVIHGSAFSVGLSPFGDVGPFDSNTTVVYDRELMDLTHAYDSSTGVYTARDSGIYYFRFSAAYIAPTSSENQCIQIHTTHDSSERSLFYVCGSSSPGGQVEYVSHAFTADLSPMQTVSVRLPAGWKLYNRNGGHNVFGGALVTLG